MSENNDAPATTPPSETPQSEHSDKMLSNDPEFITRRVLLYEVLLEEYETHCPPGEDARAREGETEQPGKRADETEKVYQPRVDENELSNLKAQVEAARHTSAGEDGGAKSDDELNARFVSKFFTMLTKAQRAEANEKYKSRGLRDTHFRDSYLGKLRKAEKLTEAEDYVKSARPGLAAAAVLDEVIDLVMAHEIHGILDDYRERARRTLAKARGTKPTDQEIESSALISWIEDLYQAKAEAKPAHTSPAPGAATAPQVPDDPSTAEADEADSDDGQKLEDL